MQADTDAIRGYGRHTTELTADLRAAAALLGTDVGPTVAAAFGPVGARFASALAGAAADLRDGVTRIGEHLAATGTATTAAASDYDDTEARSRAQLTLVGM